MFGSAPILGPMFSFMEPNRFANTDFRRVPYSVFRFRCSVFGVPLSVFRVWCFVVGVPCSVFRFLFSVFRSGFRVRCFSLRCSVLGVPCSFVRVQFPVFNFPCSMTPNRPSHHQDMPRDRTKTPLLRVHKYCPPILTPCIDPQRNILGIPQCLTYLTSTYHNRHDNRPFAPT